MHRRGHPHLARQQPSKMLQSVAIPPGTGKTHLAIGSSIRACQAGHRVLFATAAEWVDRLAFAHDAGRLLDELQRLGPLPARGHRRGRLHPLRIRRRQPVPPTRLLPLRTSQPNRHLQQTLGRVGRCLRGRHRRRRHDRPTRPPRRSRLPQTRQLPPQRPRPRERVPQPSDDTPNNPRAELTLTRGKGVRRQPVLTLDTLAAAVNWARLATLGLDHTPTGCAVSLANAGAANRYQTPTPANNPPERPRGSPGLFGVSVRSPRTEPRPGPDPQPALTPPPS